MPCRADRCGGETSSAGVVEEYGNLKLAMQTTDAQDIVQVVRSLAE
jgi:hypothetical protein